LLEKQKQIVFKQFREKRIEKKAVNYRLVVLFFIIIFEEVDVAVEVGFEVEEKVEVEVEESNKTRSTLLLRILIDFGILSCGARKKTVAVPFRTGVPSKVPRSTVFVPIGFKESCKSSFVMPNGNPNALNFNTG